MSDPITTLSHKDTLGETEETDTVSNISQPRDDVGDEELTSSSEDESDATETPWFQDVKFRRYWDHYNQMHQWFQHHNNYVVNDNRRRCEEWHRSQAAYHTNMANRVSSHDMDYTHPMGVAHLEWYGGYPVDENADLFMRNTHSRSKG